MVGNVQCAYSILPKPKVGRIRRVLPIFLKGALKRKSLHNLKKRLKGACAR